MWISVERHNYQGALGNFYKKLFIKNYTVFGSGLLVDDLPNHFFQNEVAVGFINALLCALVVDLDLGWWVETGHLREAHENLKGGTPFIHVANIASCSSTEELGDS